jgi:hypothetical protein
MGDPLIDTILFALFVTMMLFPFVGTAAIMVWGIAVSHDEAEAEKQKRKQERERRYRETTDQ